MMQNRTLNVRINGIYINFATCQYGLVNITSQLS